jgi:phage shock protein PspC (stress-responsive transcriptional regulator)
MSANCVFDEIREALNGRPGQPIVFGVCKSLAERYGKEPWIFRLIAIVLGVFFTLPALAGYIILGFVLSETEVRTRQFFAGLTVIIREGLDKLGNAVGDIFGSSGGNGRGSRYY